MAGRGSPFKRMLTSPGGRIEEETTGVGSQVGGPVTRSKGKTLVSGKEATLAAGGEGDLFNSCVPGNSKAVRLSNRASSKGSRRTSRGSYSSQLQNEMVDLEVAKKMEKLDEAEDVLLEKMRRIDEKIGELMVTIEEHKEILNDVTSVAEEEEQWRKQELLKAEASLKKIINEKVLQQAEEEIQMKSLKRKRALLVKEAKCEKNKIMEDVDQQLGSDDDVEKSADDEVLGDSIQVWVNTTDKADEEKEKDLEGQRLRERAKKYRQQAEAALEAEKMAAEDRRQQALLAADDERKRLKLVAEAVERAQLEKKIADKKAEHERYARKAEEALNKQIEESRRRMEKDAKKQQALEERLKGLTKAEAESIPEQTEEKAPTAVASAADQMALAFVKAFKTVSVNMNPAADTSKYLARQGSKKLPPFGGMPEDWQLFEADFERTTREGEYSHSANLTRLREALQGDAADYVKSLMLSPENVPQIMKDLKERYGQPEHIIRSLIQKTRSISPFNQDQLYSLIEFGKSVRNLIANVKSLQRPEHLCNPQLQKELEDKLPSAMRMQWLRWITVNESRRKDLENFGTWIGEEVSLACQVCPAFPSDEKKQVSGRGKFSDGTLRNVKKIDKPFRKVQWVEDMPTAAGLLIQDKKQMCIFCARGHESDKCVKALDMTMEKKQRKIYDKKGCIKCLSSNHWYKDCRSYVKCAVCRKPHLPVMCPEVHRDKTKGSEKKTEGQAEPVPVARTNLARTNGVMMKTLIVKVNGKHGHMTCRLLGDDGADNAYVLKSTIKKLGLTEVGQEVCTHSGFGGMYTAPKYHKNYVIELKNVGGDGYTSFRDGICGAIPRVKRGPWMKELRQHNIWLDDVGQDCPDIEILMGAAQLNEIETGFIVDLSNGYRAIETIFGWTIRGRNMNDANSLIATNLFVRDTSVEQLWDLESLGIRDPVAHKSKKEKEESTRNHFLQTVSRASDGRYSVKLPWIDGRPDIPDNRKIVEARLVETTKKLKLQGNYQKYEKLFNEWEAEGMIEVVPEEELDFPAHYLPHRAVLKPESKTTPIRPVFDASCKAYRTPSLNECLEKGLNLLELIPSNLLKFMAGMIGITSDIRKAFQMIDVHEEDRDFLRFLWWKDESKGEHKVYRHRRVVFGVNCSPFLLGAVIDHHLANVSEEWKPLANKVRNALYADNCVTSVETVEEAVELKRWSTKIMAEVKMELREWEAGFVEESGIDSLTNRECGLDFGRTVSKGIGKSITSVLGYKWDKVSDRLYCNVSKDKLPEKISKRVVLSCCQKIFDPLGFVCPATLQLKMLVQKLWKRKVEWDEELPPDMEEEFRDWYEELDHLQQIQLPRNMTGGNSRRDQWQLHCFVDASNEAYSAVVFLRTDDGSRVSVRLVMAKARVAPLEKVTINRLELLGAFIGTRLADSVRTSLDCMDVPIQYWSDSTTVLAWIKGNDEWGTFVGNRVKERVRREERERGDPYVSDRSLMQPSTTLSPSR